MEYGIFNNEGILEGCFHSESDARVMLDAFYSNDNAYIAEQCPFHFSSEKTSCEECNEEEAYKQQNAQEVGTPPGHRQEGNGIPHTTLIETRLQISHLTEDGATRVYDISHTLACTIQEEGLWRITNAIGQRTTVEGTNKNATIAAWWQAWLERP